MKKPEKRKNQGSQDDSLIDAARREILGNAAPHPSGVVLSGSSDGHKTLTANGSAGPSRSTRSAAEEGECRFTKIAQYHIKRKIASGAMGTVYEAMQEHPRRTVAVKVMKRGIASRRSLRRFEDESQILARLNHPGIAKVYEAGWHEEGDSRVPFFALEYIPRAEPIIDFANHRGLRTEDRISLFVSVCRAIHHGHQRGVIHRDIKPGNILVDSSGQAKIIDFGVARSTDSDLNLTSLQTVVGEMVGTLKYMSPEQCQADPHDLDIRADIYSLGVVLFELLSGRAPYDISTTPFVAIPKMICEEPPERLSSIDRSLRGDLEIIVHKALEKDREHRYQSALALADDLERFLRNEPILARPPSAVYRFRKLIRRRRTPLVAAAALVLLGVVVIAANIRLAAEREKKQRLLTERDLLASVVSIFESKKNALRDGRVLGLCDKLLEEDDRNVLALAMRARIHYLKGDYEAAGRDCAAALVHEPTNLLAMRTCAFVEMHRGHFASARQYYEHALGAYALANELARDLHNRARLRRQNGDYEQALTDNDCAVALSPKFGLVRKERGITRYMAGDLDGAIEDLTRALSLQGSGRVQCNQWLWEIHALRGDPGDAEEAQRALLRAAADAVDDPVSSGMIKVLRGQQAADAHLATLKEADGIAQAHYYLGVKALIEHKKRIAIDHFRKAVHPSFHGFVEYDLARWHLVKLETE